MTKGQVEHAFSGAALFSFGTTPLARSRYRAPNMYPFQSGTTPQAFLSLDTSLSPVCSPSRGWEVTTFLLYRQFFSPFATSKSSSLPSKSFFRYRASPSPYWPPFFFFFFYGYVAKPFFFLSIFFSPRDKTLPFSWLSRK